MLPNQHPQDSLPAFVLGALDIDEALLVNAHIIQCSACRAEVETFQAVLGALPYATQPREPPAHVKQQLLARIAATAPAERTGRLARPRERWVQAITGGALALSLAFGVMLYDTNSRIASIGSALNQSQQSIAQVTDQLTRMNNQHTRDQALISQINDQNKQAQQAVARMQEQLTQDQQITVFIAAPQTVHRALSGSDRRARATMYMQPDSTQAVLVVEGMPRLEPGSIYQFWLAKAGLQVPSKAFNVTGDGLAVVPIQAPAPVNQYDQVMVTIEQVSDAKTPSDRVVLSGSLATAQPPGVSRAD
jgi:anti-sigma-K factor RskA